MKLLFILLSIGLYAAILFTIGHWPLSFSKKSLLPHFRMPPKKSVTIADAPAASDAAGNHGDTIDRGETIVAILRDWMLEAFDHGPITEQRLLLVG